MQAIVIEHPGGPEAMQLGGVPDPIPGPGELLVRVRATALNRLDLAQRQGRYPVPPGAPQTLGVEMAGEVLGWGTGVQGWSTGERAFALLLGGGYAEQVAVPAAMAMRIPPTLSLEQAAAIPEAFLTAYLNLFTIGELRAGDWALIHGGASGVGTAASQLVREWGGRSIVTVGSAAKAERCLQLGATLAINYNDGPFESQVAAATAGSGASVILDIVGAPYFEQNLRALATGGRLIILSSMGGATVEINLGALQGKRARLIGSTLRPLPLDQKVALTREFSAFALRRLQDGRLQPVIDRVYDLADAPQAHRYMESNANVGKIVLRVP